MDKFYDSKIFAQRLQFCIKKTANEVNVCFSVCSQLTHWGRDKMAAIFQATYIQMHFLVSLDSGLAPIRRQAIIWTNDG